MAAAVALEVVGPVQRVAAAGAAGAVGVDVGVARRIGVATVVVAAASPA